MDELNTNSSAENTENQAQAAEIQQKPKSTANASDLLSRLNKNISENPTSGRRFTTKQPEPIKEEPEIITAAEEEPLSAEAQPAENIEAQQPVSEPAVTENVYNIPDKANRQTYKMRVTNRAKDSYIPENVPDSTPAVQPEDMQYTQDDGQYAQNDAVSEQYPQDNGQYTQNQPQIGQPAQTSKSIFKWGKKNKEDDDPWADMVEDNSEQPAVEIPSGEIPAGGIPAKLKDRYEGIPKPEKRKSKKERDEEELQRRIADAEKYVNQMQTGEVSVPKVDEKTGIPVKDPNSTFDETDMNLMVAFGMEQELKERVGEERAEKFTESIDRSGEELDDDLVNKGEAKAQKEYFEFTDPEQVKPIFKRYRADYANLLWRILSCAILLIITFFYENIEIFGGSLPPMFNSTSYPVVHVLTGLQLLVLGGALIYRKLWDGVNELLRMKPTPDSMAAVLMAVSVLYHVILCFCGVYTGIRLLAREHASIELPVRILTKSVGPRNRYTLLWVSCVFLSEKTPSKLMTVRSSCSNSSLKFAKK